MNWRDWGCLTPIIPQPVRINQTNLTHLTVYRPYKHQSTLEKRLEWQNVQTSTTFFSHDMVSLKLLQLRTQTDSSLLMCIEFEIVASLWNGDFIMLWKGGHHLRRQHRIVVLVFINKLSWEFSGLNTELSWGATSWCKIGFPLCNQCYPFSGFKFWCFSS